MTLFLLIFVSYFLGSIPFSYIVPKMTSKIDIRSVGSGNTGTTNVVRTLGLRIGVLAFIGDFLKGLLPTLIGISILGQIGGLIGGGVAVLGHCYSVWLGFKGGKGIATSAGVIVALFPQVALILVIWQFFIIFVTRYMSLASITSAVLFPILVIAFGNGIYAKVFALVLGAFVIYRHRANLQRLLKGEEKKLIVAKGAK